MFEIEPTGEKTFPCDCCGQTSHTLWGYVHEHGHGPTRAVYYVGWVEEHAERLVQMTLSLGRWGDGTTAADRRSVGIEIRAPEGTAMMGVVDEPFVAEPELLGEALSRHGALATRTSPISGTSRTRSSRRMPASERAVAQLTS